VAIAFSALFLIVSTELVTRRMTLVPSKGQAALEYVYSSVRNGMARDIIGTNEFRPFLPLLFSLFTIILLNNFFGEIPIIQYPTMSRIGVPIALTLVSFIVYNVVGFRRKGFRGYLASLVAPGLPKPLRPVIFVLEFITNFITRPITLALRLFGNMFASHLLLLLFSLAGEYFLFHGANIGLRLVAVPSYVMYAILTPFEMLIDFLQAYIFTLLTAFYIAGSIADEH
jgi:F-type H+-transporting ATPase subunit a